MRLLPNLELVRLEYGTVLYETDRKIRHVYFPTDCVVSLLHFMEDGASVEFATVGREGVVGAAVALGGEHMPCCATVYKPGFAYRLARQILTAEFDLHGALHGVWLRHIQSLMTQMALTAACNRHHRVDEQLCRWLLLALDQADNNCVSVTHESIASMLGVRREGITQAAGKLQKLGVISYSRGQITVLDRPALESLSCECYRVLKREQIRLFRNLS